MINSKIEAVNNLQECNYPCLKMHKSTGDVVLFLGYAKGIFLGGGITTGIPLGKHVKDFDENFHYKDFLPFVGQITLSNKPF